MAATGQTPGKMFTFGPNLTTTQDTGTTWATLTIKSTGAGANYLRNLEVVHEDYCDGGKDKSFRTVEPGSNFVTEHTKSQWAHCGAIRMLSSLEVCYLLYPPEQAATGPPEERGVGSAAIPISDAPAGSRAVSA